MVDGGPGRVQRGAPVRSGLPVDGEPDTQLVAALLQGGDERTALDPATGLNRYLCPPHPVPEVLCLSSCTASPISAVGFERAARMHAWVAAAPAGPARASRIKAFVAAIGEALLRGFGAPAGASVVLCPSGTDALRLAAVLLSSERPAIGVTAVLPAPAETGTGVPAAAAAVGAGCVPADVVVLALRGADGEARPAADVGAAFVAAALAARARGRRPVTWLTDCTKTGLTAPSAVPAGDDVVVDASQARLAPGVVAGWLGRGWPVVLTGSKFLGGPAFSGALLLPPGRFGAAAVEVVSRKCGVPRGAAALGVALRWEAALPGLEAAGREPPRLEALLREADAAMRHAVGTAPGVRLVGDGGAGAVGSGMPRLPGIWTVAVADPRHRRRWLSAGELRPLWQGLARAGVLLGQPVDLGPFGGLRVAVGARDLAGVPIAAAIARAFAALQAERRALARGCVDA